MGENPDRLLLQMLHDCERLIDHQVRGAEELDGKSEAMLRITIAIAGGALAMAGLVVGQFTEQTPGAWIRTFASLAGAAAFLNAVTMVAFVTSYVGFWQHMSIAVAPSASWIRERLEDDSWTDVDNHLAHVVAAYAGYEADNLRAMRRSAAWRRAGVYLMLATLAGYATAGVYILSRGM